MSKSSHRLGAAAAVIAALAVMSPKLGFAQAQSCVAVFDFELIDSSLDGQTLGSNPAESNRLGLLSTQLRAWIDAESGWKNCDMAPVLNEARAANLSACGCIPRLIQSVGGRLAVVGSVHKVSNLILNINVDIFDATTGQMIVQQNADIRSNSDSSWKRGLDWLIEHRLDGVFKKLKEVL